MKIIIVWQKPVDSMPGLIAVRRAGNNCDFLPPDQVWVVPVITPLNTVPAGWKVTSTNPGVKNKVSFQPDDPPSKRVVKSVVDLPNGLYTLRAKIGGQVITKPLAIVRLF